ncbi:MAG: glycosyltransferase family 39 protein [Anaerolineales bacterium]
MPTIQTVLGPIQPEFRRLAGGVIRFPWQHLVPFAYFTALYLFYPFRNVFQFDPDEGINLMKAMLVAHGYPLYTQIWSDQPPVFTQILAISFRLFGMQVNVARIVVLAASALLIWALSHYLRVVWGFWAMLAGIVIVSVLPYYFTLSVSTMIGLPSIAFAMLSLASLTAWHQKKRLLWLTLSAVLLGISVFTKLWTGIFAPVFLGGIFLDRFTQTPQPNRWHSAIRPIVVWITVLAITLLLAVVGVLMAIRSRRWLSMYLLAWAIFAYILLSLVAPVWYHQQMLLTIPIAGLGAIAAGEIVQQVFRWWQSRRVHPIDAALFAAALVCTYLVVINHLLPFVPAFTMPPNYAYEPTEKPPREMQVINEIQKYAPQTRWMVTDLPMYAFRADILVPPELAVFSRKRLVAGDLTDQELQAAFQKYDPELVMLDRFDYPGLQTTLDAGYEEGFTFLNLHLYVRKDINKDAP